ncbi:hypothetical protein CC85DRAFT_286082 [Cutaneotrichosporon oleaginosum]|uniref:Uncharacterized protein n=1 Tax=Cutaneotrichosporon oleaginosum TaxID=879819 RepID=A0A0J1B2M1_9TREE|nr:uncharacterized protein CC85DRAFT_286082 [Cutaneotrichosporon oleaginosum]KLT41844.1 hypothetical protein CC85DRAFT_286082 [Cutaneotrichosporon oleaginosum]TXT14764.1 hypothetical protein COLE_00957 [Cutaneotrichosporon oleaginosum]
MTDKVADNADAHRELLLSLQAVDYAPPTLAQVKKQLSTSQTELEQEKRTIALLEASTKKEFKDWKDIQQRTHKRVWTRLKHPSSHREILSAREEKEEREYVDALAKEQASKARIETLEVQVTELAQQVKDLEPYAREHANLTRQLAQLYARVFDGPTPGYPEEDAAERAFQEAARRFDGLQGEIANEKRAQELLRGALQRMAMAVRACASAESYSQWDMFGGGTMSDMMERSELANAQRAADQARMMVMQAQTLQPAIRGFGPINMPQGNLMSDVFFDNIFTDYAFHQKIKAAAVQLQRAFLQLQDVTRQSQGHLEGLLRDGRDRAHTLEGARNTLELTRRQIMERAGGVAPPTYAPPSAAPAGQAPPYQP